MVDISDSTEYLTILQAAKFLGVSPKTLRRWDAEGKLSSIRHPGNGYRYYKRSDLEPLSLGYSRAEKLNPGEFFQVTDASITNNVRLREPQREAYSAIKQHFRSSADPAIIQIPVGCGKTGVIAILPFGISTGRVLIIAPNKTIRTGISEALDIGNPKFFLGKTKVLPSFMGGPFAAVLDGPQANIHDCTESHYVVTNIQQLASSADRWLPQFPPNFFDMIIVDEGHHNVADSWKKVFDRFPEAKVVSLTATPFRGDGQPLTGEVVYRYSYARAMMEGYIKQIHSLNVSPDEIYFTYRGDEKRHSLEEVMELREQAWFRKGVALSPECNAHIVDASIQRLQDLRVTTGKQHQIIASACSVDHARQIRALYEQRGLKAKEIFSEMEADKQDRALAALASGSIDCIVQVQMLGEGFDHPPLSVAAIFRPYRSLSPYVQFVGRIMRTMSDRDAADPANHGFVISHVGLNNDPNWDDFREFDLEDQEIFRLWLESNPQEDFPMFGNGPRNGRRFDTNMLVHTELLGDFLRQSFLDPNDERVIDRILETKIPGVGLPLSTLMSREQVKEMLSKAQQNLMDGNPESIPVSPQKRRQTARKRLEERTKSVALRILNDLALPVQGWHIGKTFFEARAQNNLIGTICLMHRDVNRFLGIDSKQRDKMSADQAERALDALDDIGDSLRDSIKQSLR